MSDSRHSKSYLPQKLSKLSHFWPINVIWRWRYHESVLMSRNAFLVSHNALLFRCLTHELGNWPSGMGKNSIKKHSRRQRQPRLPNTGDVAIMISEYPWEIKCPQNRSSAWFLSNSIFLRVTQHLSPVAIKDELIWPAKTLQHFVVAAAASRSH